MEERIRQRIEQLKAERDAFIAQANLQIAAYAGAIQALEQLLGSDSLKQPDSGVGEGE